MSHSYGYRSNSDRQIDVSKLIRASPPNQGKLTLSTGALTFNTWLNQRRITLASVSTQLLKMVDGSTTRPLAKPPLPPRITEEDLLDLECPEPEDDFNGYYKSEPKGSWRKIFLRYRRYMDKVEARKQLGAALYQFILTSCDQDVQNLIHTVP